MARLEAYYICPTCSRAYLSLREALRCRDGHVPDKQTWVVGRYRKIQISEHAGQADTVHAMRLADMRPPRPGAQEET